MDTFLNKNFGITSIYHMTHIDNLDTIFKHGLLAHGNPYQKKDISDCDVNSRRDRIEPIYNKPIHSYVPFYFNPKNNMLLRRKNISDDIVILRFSNELLFKENVLFTDANASTDRANFYKNIEDLKYLNWDCIFTTGLYNDFEDGGNKRMAEVLIPSKVEIDNLEAIITRNNETKEKVLKILEYNKISDIKVLVDGDKKFFF
jgi:hypothetical protein